jgi:hypothetical protein
MPYQFVSVFSTFYHDMTFVLHGSNKLYSGQNLRYPVNLRLCTAVAKKLNCFTFAILKHHLLFIADVKVTVVLSCLKAESTPGMFIYSPPKENIFRKKLNFYFCHSEAPSAIHSGCEGNCSLKLLKGRIHTRFVQNLRLSETTDMSILWKALEEHFVISFSIQPQSLL